MAEVQDGAPNAAPAPESTKEQENKGEDWKFIPLQPIRDDQVQNAVNFLSHPKVKGSPIAYRRSFLERKGLSREEIDEAFRRVPDPPTNAKSFQPAATPAVSIPQLVAQSLPSVAPSVALAPVGTLVQGPVAVRRRASWAQMVLAIGLLSAAGAGAAVAAKKYFFPRLKAWLRRVVLDEGQLEPRKARPTVEPVKAVEATVLTEMTALVRELMNFRAEERRYHDGVVKSLEAQIVAIKLNLEAQTREMKHSLDAINGYIRRANSPVSEANGFSSHKGLFFDGKTTRISSGSSEQLGNVMASRPFSAPSVPVADNPLYSPSYLEVLEMSKRGETPSNVKQVNDKPPNPNQAPSYSLLPQTVKPWEKVDSRNDKVENTGAFWRQKDGMKITEQNDGVKITEIEESQQPSNSGTFSAGYGVNETGISRTWVPPPAPKALLPGVEAAIKPKSPVERVEPVEVVERVEPVEVVERVEPVEVVEEPSEINDDSSENSLKQVEEAASTE